MFIEKVPTPRLSFFWRKFEGLLCCGYFCINLVSSCFSASASFNWKSKETTRIVTQECKTRRQIWYYLIYIVYNFKFKKSIIIDPALSFFQASNLTRYATPLKKVNKLQLTHKETHIKQTKHKTRSFLTTGMRPLNLRYVAHFGEFSYDAGKNRRN